MLVRLKTNGGYSFTGVVGKKVIANKYIGLGYVIALSELYRVCENDPYGRDEGLIINCNQEFFFSESDVDIVQPKLVNCTDRNVGKGWA